MIAALASFVGNVACALCFAAPFLILIGTGAVIFRRQLAAFDSAGQVAADSIGRGISQ